VKGVVKKKIREGQLVKIRNRPLGLLNILKSELRFPISKNLDLFSPNFDFDFEKITVIAFKRVKNVWIIINRRGGHIWMLVKRKDLEPILVEIEKKVGHHGKVSKS